MHESDEQQIDEYADGNHRVVSLPVVCVWTTRIFVKKFVGVNDFQADMSYSTETRNANISLILGQYSQMPCRPYLFLSQFPYSAFVTNCDNNVKTRPQIYRCVSSGWNTYFATVLEHFGALGIVLVLETKATGTNYQLFLERKRGQVSSSNDNFHFYNIFTLYYSYLNYDGQVS